MRKVRMDIKWQKGVLVTIYEIVIEIHERIIPVTLRRHIWKVFKVELIELGDCLDVGDEEYGRVKVNVTKFKWQSE